MALIRKKVAISQANGIDSRVTLEGSIPLNCPFSMMGRTVGTTGSNRDVVEEMTRTTTAWAAWARARKRFERRSERLRSTGMGVSWAGEPR